MTSIKLIALKFYSALVFAGAARLAYAFYFARVDANPGWIAGPARILLVLTCLAVCLENFLRIIRSEAKP